jgi:signal transduction histidine kinase
MNPEALVFTFGSVSTGAIGLVLLLKWHIDDRRKSDLAWAAAHLCFAVAIAFAAIQQAYRSEPAGMIAILLFWVFAALMIIGNRAFIEQEGGSGISFGVCLALAAASFGLGLYRPEAGYALFTTAAAVIYAWTGWILRKLPQIGTVALWIFALRAFTVLLRPLFADTGHLFQFSVLSFTANFIVGATLVAGSLLKSRNSLRESEHRLRINNTELLAKETELRDSYRLLEDQTIRLEHLGTDYATALERAEKAVRAKDSFISNMNHEFRTPLNAVLGFSELVQAEAVRNGYERIVEYSGYTLEAGRALLRNVDRILEFISLDSGHREAVNSLFDPREAIYEEITALAQMAVAKRLTIARTLDTAPEIWPGDEKAFRIVVDELLRNALKAAPESSTVTIHMTGDKNELMLGVADAGPGLSDHFLKTVGESFNISEHVLHRGGAVQGVGLGLCIASRYVKLMGGALTLDRNTPNGTVARLVLSAA